MNEKIFGKKKKTKIMCNKLLILSMKPNKYN